MEAALSIDIYPLCNSAILDSGATFHIFNQASRFLNFRRAVEGDSVWAGDARLPIIGYGNVDIEVTTMQGKRRVFRLFNVACCERLVCNLVSLRQLRRRGFYWDTQPDPTILRRSDGSELCAVPEKLGQFVLEYVPNTMDKAAFATRRNEFNSWTGPRPRLVSARVWHLRLGHPGPEALNHLQNAAKGVRIKGVRTKGVRIAPRRKLPSKKADRASPAAALTVAVASDVAAAPEAPEAPETCWQACQTSSDCPGMQCNGIESDGPPKTTQCDACAMGKMKRQERRRPRDISRYKPGERITLDFHDFETDEEGYKCLMLISDRLSGYLWDYYIQGNRTTADVITAFDLFFLMMERQYGVKVKVVECDNEIIQKLPGVKQHLEARSIALEPSPANTQHLNGAAERSGGIVQNVMRSMAIGAKFPNGLWREVGKTAVYLLNRTPRQRLQWKTPYEWFHRQKPDLGHLRVFGCKAYAMTKQAQLKTERLKRLNPRAWVGYLLGYSSTNVYRIWNPAAQPDKQVIRTRDVIFDEDKTFSGEVEDMKNDVKEMTLEDLAQLLQSCALPEQAEEDQV